MKVYLAGAIRAKQGIDGLWKPHPQDWAWRSSATRFLRSRGFEILDPTFGKVVHTDVTNEPCSLWRYHWTVADIPFEQQDCYKTDRFHVEQADIIIANLDALEDNYPCIGTLIELGWADQPYTLVYVISELESIKTHPLLSGVANRFFKNTTDCIEFVAEQFGVE